MISSIIEYNGTYDKTIGSIVYCTSAVHIPYGTKIKITDFDEDEIEGIILEVDQEEVYELLCDDSEYWDEDDDYIWEMAQEECEHYIGCIVRLRKTQVCSDIWNPKEDDSFILNILKELNKPSGLSFHSRKGIVTRINPHKKETRIHNLVKLLKKKKATFWRRMPFSFIKTSKPWIDPW